MATVKPFAALRPPRDLAARVAAPPYDVIDTAEARSLAAPEPESYLYVSRPEIALAEGIDEHDDAVYAQGARALEAFVARKTLVRDAAPRFYAYAQRMGSHRQLGLVACAAVDEYDRDLIKKHEKTRADKEDDRTRHIDELSAHDEPVFLTYRARAEIDRALADATNSAPEYDFVTADGVAHTLWVLDDARNAEIETLFRDVPALYVADGHHRSAAASRVHARRRAAGLDGDHAHFLAVLFPHDQMQILAYNRLVRDAQGRDAQALEALLATRFELEPCEEPAPSESKTFGVYVGGRWLRARVRPGTFDANDPVASLDCSIVQEQLLSPLFGIDDPRRDNNVGFVGGIRGARELERKVDAGAWSLALHLYPTRIEELIAVSDAGLLMPPKSTWFEPKLRSGLFVHTF